jgi:hypothetical protein
MSALTAGSQFLWLSDTFSGRMARGWARMPYRAGVESEVVSLPSVGSV